MRHALLTLALIGCTGDHATTDPGSAPTGGKADSSEPSTTGPVHYLDSDFAYWAERSGCAVGQGNVLVGSFTPATFSASEMLTAIKAEDAERGCSGRTYSTSKAAAATAFADFAAHEESFTNELADSCTAYGIDGAEITTKLSAFIADPHNVAVFSSVHDRAGADDPVGCFYYRFYVLRANGTAARLYFDWSD